MEKKNVIKIPVRKIENPPPREDWGTKIAEFRGQAFQLLCIIDQGKEDHDWISANKWPYIAQCIKKSDGGNSAIEILKIKPREKN